MKKNLLFTIIGLIAGTTLTATAAYVYTARDINYQPSDENWLVNNVQEALTELKTDVNNINNKVEGIERVYKAGEVELVALVSDDSFYTDSNGKYVLSNSDTGRTLLADTSTYKSLASTSDCVGIVGQDVVNAFSSSNIEFIEGVANGNAGTVSINKSITLTGKKYILHTSISNGYGSISSVTSSFSVKLNDIELTPTSQNTDNSKYIIKNYIIESQNGDTLTINISGNGGAMGVNAYLDKIS